MPCFAAAVVFQILREVVTQFLTFARAAVLCSPTVNYRHATMTGLPRSCGSSCCSTDA